MDDLETEDIFADAQLLIWAAEGLFWKFLAINYDYLNRGHLHFFILSYPRRSIIWFEVKIFSYLGLSRLVSASFTEDVFGVVQKVLCRLST